MAGFATARRATIAQGAASCLIRGMSAWPSPQRPQPIRQLPLLPSRLMRRPLSRPLHRPLFQALIRLPTPPPHLPANPRCIQLHIPAMTVHTAATKPMVVSATSGVQIGGNAAVRRVTTALRVASSLIQGMSAWPTLQRLQLHPLPRPLPRQPVPRRLSQPPYLPAVLLPSRLLSLHTRRLISLRPSRTYLQFAGDFLRCETQSHRLLLGSTPLWS